MVGWPSTLLSHFNHVIGLCLAAAYLTSPGPIYHVDSEYEVRNQIWDLCQVLWAGLC